MLRYKTSDYMAWFFELGFKVVKVFLKHGPDEGFAGLNKNVEIVTLPGTPVIKNGRVKPSDASGFGTEVDLNWIEGRAFCLTFGYLIF
jgi:hypothetical protein